MCVIDILRKILRKMLRHLAIYLFIDSLEIPEMIKRYDNKKKLDTKKLKIKVDVIAK